MHNSKNKILQLKKKKTPTSTTSFMISSSPEGPGARRTGCLILSTIYSKCELATKHSLSNAEVSLSAMISKTTVISSVGTRPA